jgi:replication initiation protein RepC
MTQTGWRKPTPGLLRAEEHAKAGEQLSIPKSQATKAVKRVAAHIGLKHADIILLDTLCAFTQDQDWEQGRRPIVWASNAYLEERTGMDLRSVQRHVRRLIEVGVICAKDSANGKRYGKRSDDGYIQVAYGFDLAPLAARTEEFEALEARMAEEREFIKSLKSKLVATRRIIWAQLDKARESRLRGPWRELEAEYEALVPMLSERKPAAEKLLNILDVFRELKERVEQAFRAAFDWPEQSDVYAPSQEPSECSNVVSFSSKMSPTDDKNDTHILTTNQPLPVNSNSFEEKHVASTEPESERAVGADSPEKVDLDFNWSTHGRKRGSDIDIPMLMIACPQFAELARGFEGGFVRDWNDFHRAAAKIRPISGISEDAWNAANKVLGPQIAAASIALIYDKHSNGQVLSPGGYLRALVQRAQAGELHLDRTFFGRLSEARAQ